MIPMRRTRCVFGMAIVASILLAQSGCALFTARSVAMAGGKVVAKKAYEKYKEDKAKDDHAQDGQASQE